MDERKLVSRAVYIMKAIAIITVAMAHCTFLDADIQRVTNIFGTIGVPIFLITGGLFYNNNKPLMDFCHSKLKRIVVPWLIWGLATYVLHILSDRNNVSLIELVKWIIGYKTWLYYVPVVLICYLIFRLSTSTRYAILVLTASLVSYVLTSIGILDLDIITSCQNPFNWIVFFAIGIIIKNCGYNERVFLFDNRICATTITGGLFIIMGIGYYLFAQKVNITPSYWNILSVPFELIACSFVYYFSVLSADSFKCILLEDIGKNSYPLFFSHMQIGINVVNIICFPIWNRMHGVVFAGIAIIRGCLVILLSYFVFVFLTKRVLKLLKIEKLGWVIGL